MTIGNDFRIVSDKTADGVRHICAIPSQLVCSVQIDFDLKDGKIYNLKYTRGCEGNLVAIGKLLEGTQVEKIINVLDGNDCHQRGTSCSDQLVRILKEATKE